jgi:hypothetical protein
MIELPRSVWDSHFAHTCWHEAGHAVAGFLLNVPILEIVVLGPDELAEHHAKGSEEHWGFVLFGDYPEDTLGRAIDSMIISLAGEASVRVSWALGVLEAIRTEAPPDPVTLEEITEAVNTVPEGATPASSAAYFGYRDGKAAAIDLRDAEEVADRWTWGGPDRAALVAYAQASAAEWVQTPRFQSLLGRLSASLLERGSMPGSFAEDLLRRANRIFDLEGNDARSNT